MNDYFREYWGILFPWTPLDQKQPPDLAQWIHRSFKNFEDLTIILNRMYSVNQYGGEVTDYLWAWKKFQEEWRRFFINYLNLIGLGSGNEHLALLGKYEKLKEKAATQEETIKQLRLLLSKAPSRPETTVQFDDLLRKQSEQFQKLMNNFSYVFGKAPQAREAKAHAGS